MTEQAFDYWSFFAEETRRADAPLYTRFVEGIAQDDDLKALAATVRKGQPMANILLAAVHVLLLRGAEHPLRRLYPNLNGGVRLNSEDAFPLFRDFVEHHRVELVPLIATKVTNTNEVGRSAFLHAGFRATAAQAGTPLHLIEIGPSAGLNQRWDSYRVNYRRGDEAFGVGLAGSQVVIETELRGAGIPPHGKNPEIGSRVGLELNPVDLGDPDQRDWLRALVWPDHIARFGQLENALAMAQGWKPNIRVGDALASLPEVLAEIPAGEPVCVYHTFVTYQFSAEMREALDDMLVGISVRRPVHRLSIEGTLSGAAPMLLYSYRDGAKDKQTLANCSPHGSWLEWQAP
ncbi:MAG: DUF2332 domain-containing protein [Rhizomicrobium sp.]|jgi:hypothetical protein